MASPNWYNPLFRCMTNIRTVKLRRTAPDWYIQGILRTRRDLRIYTVVSHNPMLSEADEDLILRGIYSRSELYNHQRMKDEDGSDYIDEFGFHVYVTSRVGTSQDIDMRYGLIPDPELFKFQLVEHDLFDRDTHRRVGNTVSV